MMMTPGQQDWVYSADFNQWVLEKARSQGEEAPVWRYPAARQHLREVLEDLADQPEQPLTRGDLVRTIRALTEMMDSRLQGIHGDLNSLAEAVAPNRHRHRTLSDVRLEAEDQE